MDTAADSSNKWRFGVFEADAREGQLRRGGRPVKMREQSFRILIFLLEHAGEIVSREDLRRVLWPSDTYVDFDHSLNTAVMKLREALGDSAEAPIYIETIPKRGYRFVAPTMKIEDAKPAAQPASEPVRLAASNVAEPEEYRSPSDGTPAAVASAPALTAKRLTRRRRVELVGAIAGLLLITTGAHFLRRAVSSHRPAPNTQQHSSHVHILPVTSASGDAIAPVFSPSGREIAYLWNGPQRRHYDVYVQLLGSDAPLRLTYTKGGLVGAPEWAPGGTEIAFTRCDGKNDGVYAVPALGGEERRLTTGGCRATLPGRLAWLPDGKSLLMFDHCPEIKAFGVVRLVLATGEKRCLVTSGLPQGSDAGAGLALSPDFNTVAFVRETGSSCCDIYTVPLTGGAAHLVMADDHLGCDAQTELSYGCDSLMWTPDSKSIVFVSNRTTLPSLWRVSAMGGAVEREINYPAVGDLSADGARLIYSEQSRTEMPAIWRADLARMGGPVLAKTKLTGSQYPDMDAQPSPDGAKIVWDSMRTGWQELWISNSDGKAAFQLTHLAQSCGTPRWSPDGRSVAFDNYTGGIAQIMIIDAEGRNLLPIVGGPDNSMVPSWSKDGRFIYFVSDRTGSAQIWRHSMQSGADVQLTERGGFDPFESYDGQTIYFSRFDVGGIWSMPVSGGAETLVIADMPQVGYWGHWAVTQSGIYFLDAEADPRPVIVFYAFATRRSVPVLRLEQQPIRQEPSLSATMDGRTLYYTQYDRQSVIKMIEFSR